MSQLTFINRANRSNCHSEPYSDSSTGKTCFDAHIFVPLAKLYVGSLRATLSILWSYI